MERVHQTNTRKRLNRALHRPYVDRESWERVPQSLVRTVIIAQFLLYISYNRPN